MQIKSSTVLRNNYNEISALAHRSQEPIFITKNGDGDLVVQSVDAYAAREKMLDHRASILEAEFSRLSGEPTYSVEQVRAEEMSSTTTYNHTRPDGSPYYTVTDCPYTAENIHRIATRYLTQHGVELAEAAVDGWVNSETHLRNILNDRLSSIGVGIAKGVNASGEESWYCVQLFLYDGYMISWVDSSAT